MSIISDEDGARELRSFAMNNSTGRPERSFFRIRDFFVLNGEWVIESSQVLVEGTLELNFEI